MKIYGCIAICLLMLTSAQHSLRAADSEDQTLYAEQLWTFVARTGDYTRWTQADAVQKFPFGPQVNAQAVSYLNRSAVQDAALGSGACVVTQHRSIQGEVVGVTVYVRARPGYDRQTGDWFWAHYLPDGLLVKSSRDANPFDRRGFVTRVEDGRLWIFRENTPELVDFVQSGESAKVLIRIGAGPAGMTVKGPDAETVDAYLAALQQ